MFIPFWSCSESEITSRLYGCTDEDGNTNDGAAWLKGCLFPIFYVCLPVLHASAEIMATPVRLCGLPYLAYLIIENQEYNEVKIFLDEVKNYRKFRNQKDKKNKANVFVNSVYLKDTFETFKMKIDDKTVNVSYFTEQIKNHLKSKMYRHGEHVWKRDDFVRSTISLEAHHDDLNSQVSVTELEGKACIICTENQISGAFQPCGHYVVCEECYEKMVVNDDNKRTCPKCRAVIEEMLKIYK